MTTDMSLTKRERERYAERELLKHIYGTDITLEHDTRGKPYLKGSTDYISISHSKHILCIAISPIVEIGVDVEEFDDRLERVMEKFLTEKQIMLLPKQKLLRLKTLALCWSQKEAAYKLFPERAGLLGENVELDIRTILKECDVSRCLITESKATIENIDLKMILVDMNEQYEIVVCKSMNI